MDPKDQRLVVPACERDHMCGGLDADVELVEYADFECPLSGQAHHVVRAIERALGPSLRLVFRHFPRDEHPHAALAAEAAEAAGAQGEFWAMHDALFDHQGALGESDLVRYAGELGLDVERFTAELAQGVYRAHVREDFLGGIRSGVSATPTFFVDGRRHEEACCDLESLLDALEAAQERSWRRRSA
jgi:protein-disulfide isomerase